MDIIDVMLARAMTPQGQTETYVSIANAAAAKAEKAEEDAAAAIAAVTNVAEDIADKKDAADALLAEAQDALETAQQAQINMPEAYGTTGQNTDGYMTQKAVTDMLSIKANTVDVNNALAQKADVSALAAKADAATAATKAYVDLKISEIPASSGGGATVHFKPEDAGYITVIDDNGNLIASNAKESNLIEALVRAGTYTARNAVGLDIDYLNRTFARIQESAAANFDFDTVIMYGGRIKCNVADDGTINAFYGEVGYAEDGSNGQVMIYQPKFYYKRIPLTFDTTANGKIIRHEQLLLSPTNQAGFKLAPIFSGDLEYFLLPAYEGSISNDKLCSVPNASPVINITINDAEAAANARGTGWHITTMAAESANQMLEMVEWGNLNAQMIVGAGFSNEQAIQPTGANGAVSYRGMENPWGNRWRMIGGTEILGDGNHRGGAIYICNDFNYTPGTIGNNYSEVGFTLPSEYGWVNAMGYGNEAYDWVYMPIECANIANSLVPVGDNLWTVANNAANRIAAIGGCYNMQDANGAFYYACDRAASESARENYGASLMFIPTKNETYFANIEKWKVLMGVE